MITRIFLYQGHHREQPLLVYFYPFPLSRPRHGLPNVELELAVVVVPLLMLGVTLVPKLGSVNILTIGIGSIGLRRNVVVEVMDGVGVSCPLWYS